MRDIKSEGGSESSESDLGTYVSRLAYAVERGITGEVGSYGLSPIDVSLLGICFGRRDEVTATQLADLLPVDPARISRIVTKLVDMGLLRRRRLRNDRRVVMLRLTESGEELAELILGRMEGHSARLTEGISPEDMRVFRAVAERIIANHDSLQ